MRKILFVILSIVFILQFNGCTVFRIMTKNIGRTFSKGPLEIKNKIKDPVKDSTKLSVLWGGHSTALIQIHDKVLLFDPVFNNRIFTIMTRHIETGLDYESLDRLDMVFVSHSHMDHLSFGSLEYLSEKFPTAKLIFPKGVEYYLPDYNFDFIRLEIDKAYTKEFTGDKIESDSIEIIPVYTKHTGGRYGFDTYSWRVTGSCGFIVKYKGVTVYFAGDTGYDEQAFKVIGSKYKINLALIPIGPCRNCDEKGMKYHTSSIEALQLFNDLKADYMMPIHYGSIEYMREPDYPLEVLKKLIADDTHKKSESGINSIKPNLKERVLILEEGEQISLDEFID